MQAWTSSELISLVLRGIARVSPGKAPLNCTSREDSTRPKAFSWFLLPILLLTPAIVQAQPAPRTSTDIQRERVEQLKELVRTKQRSARLAPDDAAETCPIRREDRRAGSEPGRYSTAGGTSSGKLGRHNLYCGALLSPRDGLRQKFRRSFLCFLHAAGSKRHGIRREFHRKGSQRGSLRIRQRLRSR